MEEEEDEEKKEEKEEDEEEESLCQAVMTAVLKKKNLLHCNNVCITMINLRNTLAYTFSINESKGHIIVG